MTKFCSECGEKVTGKFCSGCGTPVGAAPVEEVPSTPHDEAPKEIDLLALVRENNAGTAINILRKKTGLGLMKASGIITDVQTLLKDQDADFQTQTGFLAKSRQQAWKDKHNKILELQEEMNRKIKLEKSGEAYCPKCLSTSLTAHKKGFGIGKAVIGYSLAPIGLVAGNIGAKKVRVTCMKCGHQFMAGKQK